jgi:shikimate dehydrogenase
VNKLPGRLMLLGHPIAHTLSPLFQNAALYRAGIALKYEAFDIAPAKLEDAVRRIREIGASGNVTVPHKEAFATLCDTLTPIAERVGAVNTFWVDDGALIGDNTDVGGFEEAVAEAFGSHRDWQRVALIGAGGGAAAVAAAVERWPRCSLAVWSRSAERAARLAERFADVQHAPSLASALAGVQLVVNATPLGLQADDAFPVPIHELPSHACVFDLPYVRGDTAWVRAARAAGHPAADGLGMLVAQGALAFERWFGEAPDRGVMWAAVRA